MIYIPVSGATLQGFYPMRPLAGYLKTFMDGLGPGNTPCCVQVSHALNMAGQKIPQTYDYAKQRGRSPSPIQVNGSTNYYLLAVDELEQWLTQKYGAGLNVRALAGLKITPSSDPTQRRKDMDQMKAYLSGDKGILLFRSAGAGLHTEIWDGKQILQRDMDETNLFSQARVLMWYCVS
jgi:type VI secretion system (T6SS) effector Tae4 (amidase)